MYREFKITGMACASCQNNIQTAIAKLPGVHKVNINLISSIMTVECDDNLSAQAIIKRVESIGYGATEGNEQATMSQSPVKKN